MILNWTIGVEGAGHHLLRAVVRRHLEKPSTVDKGDYYPLLEQRWRPGSRRLPAPMVKRELQRIFDRYREMGVTHVYEDTSFPFGPSRTILTRPDILDFMGLLDGICDVSVLLLYRHPVETTFSAYRRRFSDCLAQECLFTEASHQYIRSQILGSGVDFRTLEFERFSSNGAELPAALAGLMRIPGGDLDVGAFDPRRPLGAGQVPDDSRRYLETFFDDARIGQWLAFYRKKVLL